MSLFSNDSSSPMISSKSEGYFPSGDSSSGFGNSSSGLFAPIAGALASFAGQYFTNNANKSMAKDQTDFQREMSNTSYQRGMEDMRLAGLNPILAGKVGGASTPMGASAIMQNDIGSALSSASEVASAYANVANTKANTAIINARLPAVQAQSQYEANLNSLKNKTLESAVSRSGTVFGKVKGLFKDNVNFYKDSFNHDKIVKRLWRRSRNSA